MLGGEKIKKYILKCIKMHFNALFSPTCKLFKHRKLLSVSATPDSNYPITFLTNSAKHDDCGQR